MRSSSSKTIKVGFHLMTISFMEIGSFFMNPAVTFEYAKPLLLDIRTSTSFEIQKGKIAFNINRGEHVFKQNKHLLTFFLRI